MSYCDGIKYTKKKASSGSRCECSGSVGTHTQCLGVNTVNRFYVSIISCN